MTLDFSGAPKVSIGLPVYNGERYLSAAIESILKQTFVNFELIISDNASTDGTEEICRRYASVDPRVRYHRQVLNLGAAANFNRVFELAEGCGYFKWLAHDDWVAPSFLEKCVNRLEGDRGAVLCNSIVEIVDDDGRCLESLDDARTCDHLRSSDRFRAQLWSRRCMDLFGVIRRDALASTALLANRLASDRTLLVELSLCGRFVLVPEALSFNRDHRERFTRRGFTQQEELAWHGVLQPSRFAAMRTWTLYNKCLQLARDGVTDRAERWRCYWHLLRSLRFRKRWAYLMLEPLILLEPRSFYALMKLKRRIRGHRARPVPQSSASAPHMNTGIRPIESPSSGPDWI